MSRPCLTCGEPTSATRCPECVLPETKASPSARGYDAAWYRLSKRARRLQPWCSDCHTTEDLTTDHTPEAWARKAAGKSIRLRDVDVVCRPCNTRRGAARGRQAGQVDPPEEAQVPRGKPQGPLHTPGGYR